MTNTGAGYQQWREAVEVCEVDKKAVVVGERVWSLARTFRAADAADRTGGFRPSVLDET